MALAAATFLVHDVPYALAHPYWADETWVAATTRFPISDLRETTSSTPIGWSALLRAFVVGGEQRQRLEPLVFCALAVVVAYWFGRQLGWRDCRVAVAAGGLCGFAALTVPAMLVRNDLKQYTADACLALVVLALTSRLEQNWSQRNVAVLCTAVPAGMLFSHTTAFVGAASLIAIALVLLGRRQWPRLRDTLIASTGAAMVMLGVYQLFDAPSIVPGLTNYWRAYYLPLNHGLGSGVEFVRRVFVAVRPYLGLGPAWLVFALTVAGVATIAWLGRLMVAVAIVLLMPEMVALSAVKKYPLFDLRTSTFLLVVLAVTATVGVCGICALLARRSVAAGALVAAVAVIASLTQTRGFLRGHTLPDEDVRSSTAYVAEHSSADDVILVNSNSNWGFGYYWCEDQPARRPDINVHGYLVTYPRNRRIVLASDRTPAAVNDALAAGLRMAAAHSGVRIWLIQTHVIPAEKAAWRVALQKMGLTASPTGPAGLTTITPGT